MLRVSPGNLDRSASPYRLHVLSLGASLHGIGLLDVEQDENASDYRDVEDQAEDRHGVVRVTLVRYRIPHQRWEPAKQGRNDRYGEPDRDRYRGPLRPLVGHRPERPERGRAQDEREANPQARVGKALPVSPRLPRLEVVHLPEQRTGDRELDRDHRLEVLDRDVRAR
jgi:hypothetical protein